MVTGGGRTRTWQEWRQDGRDVVVRRRRLHVHRSDAASDRGGPTVVGLHGYPASSLELAGLADQLGDVDVLLPDLLGFGASDKPAGHAYSVAEQADLVEGLLDAEGVEAPVLVAGDYGALVVQELLARLVEGRGRVRPSTAVLTNASLWEHLYRPTVVQRLALTPLAPLVDRLVSERLVTRAWGGVFGDAGLDATVAHEHWQALADGDGPARSSALLQYVPERQHEHRRWEAALLDAGVPLRLVWGDADPVSGAHVADHAVQVLPDVPLRRLAGVGHVVALEAPDVLAHEVRQALAQATRDDDLPTTGDDGSGT